MVVGALALWRLGSDLIADAGAAEGTPAGWAAPQAGRTGTAPSLTAPLSEAVRIEPGVVLRVVSVAPVRAVARPGEIGGPALRVDLQARNSAAVPVELDSVDVALFYGEPRVVAPSVSGPGARPFRGAVPSGGTLRARYVFAVPDAADPPIGITLVGLPDLASVIWTSDK